MAGARLVCTCVRLPHVSRGEFAPATASGATTSLARVRWRLLSGNNRQLGMAAETFADHETARRAAGLLAQRLAEVDAELTWMGRRVGWAWAVLVHGQARAVSGRGYERINLASRALERFLTDLASAVILERGHEPHPPGLSAAQAAPRHLPPPPCPLGWRAHT